MTIGTVRNALGELAALLDVVDASSRAKAVRELNAFLEAHERTSTVAFLRKAAPRRKVGVAWTDQRVGDLLPTLQAYHRVLDRVGSKSAKETGLFVKFLEPYEEAGLAELIKAAQEALIASPRGKAKAVSSAANAAVVAAYVARLTPALGLDREFESVFGQLKEDRTVRRQEMAEIAKRMMPSPPNDPDRRKVLSAILSLHRTARGFDRKLKAMSGRSAA